jgi:hypothetical protein
MTADVLIQKHLESIGTPQARAAAKSRVLVGQGMLSSKLGYAGRIGGPAQLASEGNDFLLAIIFNSNDYPYEKLAYDGKDITLGRPSGDISQLGEFIKSQSAIIKQGYFGGVLSASWPLLDPTNKKLKVEYGGIENVGGKPLYKLKARVPGSGDMRVSLYFEPDTFHHVLTVYTYTIQPHMISHDSTEDASAKASYFTLTERFSNFKKAGDLVLPLGYAIDLTNQLQDSTQQLTWSISFSQVFYNQEIEASAFKVS